MSTEKLMPADGLVERGTPSASHKGIFPRKIEVHNVQWLIVFCLWNSATSGGGTRDPPGHDSALVPLWVTFLRPCIDAA